MDGVIRKYRLSRLTLEDRVKHGAPLPSRLYLRSIARLMYPGDNGQQHHYYRALIAAGLAGDLQVEWDYTPDADDPEIKALLREDAPPFACVTQDNFRAFLEAHGEPLPGWWFTEAERRAGDEPEQQAIQPPDSRQTQQVMAILAVIGELGFNPKLIPYGGKVQIEKECRKNCALFTPSSFEHAWKEAKRRKLLEVENVERYRPAKS